MKFLRAATAAALTGLLLLVPASYGLMTYECVSKNTIPIATIEKYEKKATVEKAKEGDPEVPRGQRCKAKRFTVRLPNRETMLYLLQVIGPQPSYQLYEYHEPKWHPCLLRQGTWLAS
ncbi:unnamed protein product [Blumeria hordei]|uniref:Uncharacterized protein n=2 Tax=Blumeria hordei TaxID=2867405 RepID=A0A383UVP0_BLUHO|nr:CSEP0221 putative effector protein [Blumeria hordei DH14]SZF04424.1 unnamed protein product [Blumeria hordei]